MRRLAFGPVGVVVVLKTALDLVVVDRYGWHRDTLYYAIAGKHLQGGYVEFPPVAALISALARVLFGWSLLGFRIWPVLAGAGTVVVAALVARDLGGSARAQTLAAIAVAFSPGVLATNDLFQPLAFDQLTTMLVLWLALRLAQGRGSWILLGIAAGVGPGDEVFDRGRAGAPDHDVRDLATRRAAYLGFSGRGRDRRCLACAEPDLGGGSRLGERALVSASAAERYRRDASAVRRERHSADPRRRGPGRGGRRRVARSQPGGAAARLDRRRDGCRLLLLGGKSYYGLPSILFALAAGAIPFERWATRRRLWAVGAAYVVVSLVLLPITLPVLPLKTAEAHGVIGKRADYGDEIGWPAFVRTVERHAAGSDVVIVSNYGEAGALEVFGRNLPPVASAAVTFRFWRPEVTGREAVLVGYDRKSASAFCERYRLVARISMPVANDERNQPIAHCTLNGSLADVWPTIVDQFPV